MTPKKHVNKILPPTQSWKNPANLFMFNMCFSFPEGIAPEWVADCNNFVAHCILEARHCCARVFQRLLEVSRGWVGLMLPIPGRSWRIGTAEVLPQETDGSETSSAYVPVHPPGSSFETYWTPTMQHWPFIGALSSKIAPGISVPSPRPIPLGLNWESTSTRRTEDQKTTPKKWKTRTLHFRSRLFGVFGSPFNRGVPRARGN